MCLLHTLPATKLSLEEIESYAQFALSLTREEAKTVPVKHQIMFYLHYFYPEVFNNMSAVIKQRIHHVQSYQQVSSTLLMTKYSQTPV